MTNTMVKFQGYNPRYSDNLIIQFMTWCVFFDDQLVLLVILSPVN